MKNGNEAFEKYFKHSDEKDIVAPKLDEAPVSTVAVRRTSRTKADGNIKTIHEFGDFLRRLLNIVWSSDWGTLQPSSARGDDAAKIKIPQITYDLNLRECCDGYVKPVKFDTTVVPGGDFQDEYRQYFLAIVEFNIYDSSALSTSILSERFETVIQTYTGLIKKAGISDIFFLKEVPAKYSLNYITNVPMTCLTYCVKFERNFTSRQEALKEIGIKLGLYVDEESIYNK